MAAPREVGVVAMEDMEVRQVERARDHLGRRVEIARARQQARGLGAIGRLVEPLAGFEQRLDQRLQRLGFFSAHASVVPSTFSGMPFQMSGPVSAMRPMPSTTARWFHGSPTQ